MRDLLTSLVLLVAMLCMVYAAYAVVRLLLFMARI